MRDYLALNKLFEFIRLDVIEYSMIIEVRYFMQYTNVHKYQ